MMRKKNEPQHIANMLKRKEPVKLRQRKLKNGNYSLYLDCYTQGHRQYEFLKLYLVPETDDTARQQNLLTLEAAYYVKSLRTKDAIVKRLGLPTSMVHGNIRLVDLVQSYADERRKPGAGEKEGRSGSVMTLRMHLIAYAGEDVRLKDVDREFCMGFARYLKTAKNLNSRMKGRTQIAAGTAYLKYSMLRSVLNEAVRKGYIEENPAKLIPASSCPKKPDTERDFLSTDEVKQLIQTPYRCYPMLKRAFLFSCFTGLRRSDIFSLTWREIISDGEKLLVYKRIQKTQRWLSLPLSEQARLWLPERSAHISADDRVFGLMASSSTSIHIRRWVTQAGITQKHVTFHTARHTFATLELSLGVDLYTVAKLLGHCNITTTQVYAKVVDKQKEHAVSLIDGAF